MEEEKEKPRCEICNKTFSSLDGLEHHNRDKHPETIEKPKKKFLSGKTKNWGIFILVTGLIIAGIVFSFSGGTTLPPTTMQGHIEANPPSHVLKEPMSIEIQKHMLEHVDGISGGRPGVIINYNCIDYSCETDLIPKLEAFAGIYDYVYVAPFKGMDAKIALTKLNKIEILEGYDVNKIHIFISGRIPTNEELGISTPASSETQEEPPVEVESIKEFSMTAKQWEFIPSEITVNEGDTVKLSIKSIDVAHGIFLREFGIDEYLSPGNTVNIEFVADKKGEFSFFCNVSCGVGHTGMRGKLIVE